MLVDNSSNITSPGEITSGGRLVSARDLSTKQRISDIGLTLDRINQLTKSGHLPYYRICEDIIRYKVSEVMEWIESSNLITYTGVARDFPRRLSVMINGPYADPGSSPKELSYIEDLMEMNEMNYPPCVYFLCREGKVVYVGQSIQLGYRITTHNRDKEFDQVYYIAVPEKDLFGVESTFIHILKPEYNNYGKDE